MKKKRGRGKKTEKLGNKLGSNLDIKNTLENENDKDKTYTDVISMDTIITSYSNNDLSSYSNNDLILHIPSNINCENNGKTDPVPYNTGSKYSILKNTVISDLNSDLNNGLNNNLFNSKNGNIQNCENIKENRIYNDSDKNKNKNKKTFDMKKFLSGGLNKKTNIDNHVNDNSNGNFNNFGDEQHNKSLNKNSISQNGQINSFGENYEKKYIQNIKKIRYKFDNKTKWLSKTDICCLWCCHQFDTVPIAIPKKYDSSGTYHLFGCFCGFNCAGSYIFNNGNISSTYKWEYYSLLNKLYKDLSENEQYEKILLAPPRECLKMFGGFLSIDEFRCHSKSRLSTYKMIMPPMIPIVATIENSIVNK